MRNVCRALLPAALLGAACTALAVPAYGEQPKFKVGDHVEFTWNAACLGVRDATPATGTIVQVNTTPSTMNYMIKTDPEPGRSSGTLVVPIYHQDCGIKAVAAPNNPNAPVNGNGGAPAHAPNGQPAQPNGGAAVAQGGAKFNVGDGSSSPRTPPVSARSMPSRRRVPSPKSIPA